MTNDARTDTLRDLYESWAKRAAANPTMDLATMRDMYEESHLLATEPEGITYRNVDANGVSAMWVIPEGAPDDAAIIYTHGGGCSIMSMHSHRKLAGHLAKAAGVKVLNLDYRLAPEHPYPAQLDDAQAAYRWLLEQGIDPQRIATAGDSAGGNLATTLVLALRDAGEQTPAAIVGFSPWYDMEHKGRTLESNAATDALVQRPVVEMMAQMFLGENGSPTDPLTNPLYADPTGLPPMYLTAGGYETLQDNAERFADLARNAGVDVTLEITPGMQHVFPFMAGHSPEADAAITAAGNFLRRHLGL
ncbi:alpha/beta hydrolase [Rhodococcus chondri]|uniref:Alpha/beta hydrolase n=1 Tax=Rhodococcus chondri TaxID=3065941 RepID=A0ABU7JMI9_9NOCA|nr:alpha/beta hydrolase [Rhodococcus sp. CC-R104]MEE2031250.1 alpha/beta hydrolase [Rhodococcus sp. CC-R104]